MSNDLNLNCYESARWRDIMNQSSQREGASKSRKSENTELKALAESFSQHLRTLASPAGEDISATFRLDLESRFSRLFDLLKAYSGPPEAGLANKIHAALLKAVPKFRTRVKTKFELSLGTVGLTRQILSEALSRFAPVNKKSSARKMLLKRYVSTLVEFASRSSEAISWIEPLQLVLSVADSSKEELQQIFSEEELGSIYTQLKSGILLALKGALENGDVAHARSLLNACNRHSELQSACKDAIRSIVNQSAGILPRESQQFAFRYIGVSTPAAIEYANPSESPDTRQAASLLLFLFDIRNQSTDTQEAFNRYRTISECQLALYLRGEVGSIVTFDPRLHENTGSAKSNRLRLVRPWVEWYKPPEAKIVIRGIVEPEMSPEKH